MAFYDTKFLIVARVPKMLQENLDLCYSAEPYLPLKPNFLTYGKMSAQESMYTLLRLIFFTSKVLCFIFIQKFQMWSFICIYIRQKYL